MTHEELQSWLDRYVEAWRTYDREQVTALFSDDVTYRYHPYDEPISGREEVVKSWLGEGESDDASDLDEPGTWEATYEPFAIDGDRAVATGQSSYRDEPGAEITKTYFNCFVMRFDDEGRCSEFTEWFMLRKDA
jgi:ketosteroid isomerase-like protein